MSADEVGIPLQAFEREWYDFVRARYGV